MYAMYTLSHIRLYLSIQGIYNTDGGNTATDRLMGISKNLVGFLEMPDEFFISLYILMTYEKHRKLNLRKPSKN